MMRIALYAGAAALMAAPAMANPDEMKEDKAAGWTEADAETWAGDIVGEWDGEYSRLDKESGEWVDGTESVSVVDADDGLVTVTVHTDGAETPMGSWTMSYHEDGMTVVDSEGEESMSWLQSWDVSEDGWTMVTKDKGEEYYSKVWHAKTGDTMERKVKVHPAGDEDAEWTEVYKASYTPAE